MLLRNVIQRVVGLVWLRILNSPATTLIVALMKRVRQYGSVRVILLLVLVPVVPASRLLPHMLGSLSETLMVTLSSPMGTLLTLVLAGCHVLGLLLLRERSRTG